MWWEKKGLKKMMCLVREYLEVENFSRCLYMKCVIEDV